LTFKTFLNENAQSDAARAALEMRKRVRAGTAPVGTKVWSPHGEGTIIRQFQSKGRPMTTVKVGNQKFSSHASLHTTPRLTKARLSEAQLVDKIKKLTVKDLIKRSELCGHGTGGEKLSGSKDVVVDEVTTDDSGNVVVKLNFSYHGAAYSAWLTFDSKGEDVIDVDVERDTHRDER